jgi:hypothetical protein
VSLGKKDVPEFEAIPQIGMAVRLSLHLRGLPAINYSVLKLVASYYLDIPSFALKGLLEMLGEIEFVRIKTEGQTIKSIVPTVPYFENVFEKVGEYAKDQKRLNEAEQLAVAILDKLSFSPVLKGWAYGLGAERLLVDRALQLGKEGQYLSLTRARGTDILYSPVFFAENTQIYADIVSKTGANQVKRLLNLIKNAQGWPLVLIEKTGEINGTKVTSEEISMLKRLAQDGAIKPPSIKTSYAGENYFMFTPSPGKARLTPSKREVYERAMALVASVRQGQFLPEKIAIRNPYLLLSALRDRGYLRANTEASQQYKKLTVLRVGVLENTGSGWHRFRLIENEENQQALRMAIQLASTGTVQGTEVDEEVKYLLTKDELYVESLISSQNLKEREKVSLAPEQKEELENLFLGGTSYSKGSRS